MHVELPIAGAASAELARQAHQWWIEAAKQSGIDMSDFDPNASVEERIAWAEQHGLDIGCSLARYSSKLQHSTAAQIQHNVEYAARHRIYVPPEYLCVDEAEKGRRVHRDGLDRLKFILANRVATIVLVFKVSRLLRVGYKGYQFVQEEVVEEGLRAISTSQGIDTNDEKTWKGLLYLHGMMDDMLLDTIADHCRAGLKTLFGQGYVTGALPVGYHPVEVPGAPKTKRGLPRTMPGITEAVGKMILEHYQLVADGMRIKKGWRRWVAAGGPCDPRSTVGHMTYQAYRRMLSNIRYTGLWQFGKKKNRWSTKRDYNRQVDQPESEIAVYRCEELRIVPDELFMEVQSRLAKLKHGPRDKTNAASGPKRKRHSNAGERQKEAHLWDLVTEFFWCPHCKVRFWQAGAKGRGMQCKRGDLCPCKSAVCREEATRAVCDKLIELIQGDVDLVSRLVCRAQEFDARGDDALQAEITTRENKVRTLDHKIEDLTDLAGQGTEADRSTIKARIRSAMSERADEHLELTRLRKLLAGEAGTLTPERIREILAEFTQLLEEAANGRLGADVIYKALAVFRLLTGERIWVHVERRPGRKRTNVRGVLRPRLLRAVKVTGGIHDTSHEEPCEDVQVWLRLPPLLDRLAERVHQLMDIEGQSYRDAADTLQKEGHEVNSGNVWYMYRRYYVMMGLSVPKRPYNNGRPRKSA